MSREIVIIVPDDGPLRFVYDDRLRGLLDEGEPTIRRASHVEPGDPSKGQNPLEWYADMSPVNGPVLGGFKSRELALTEEVSWLNANNLGLPSSP